MRNDESEKRRIIALGEHVKNYLDNIRHLHQILSGLTEEQEERLFETINAIPGLNEVLGDFICLHNEGGGIICGLTFLELERYEKQYPWQFGDLLHIRELLEDAKHEINNLFGDSPEETEPAPEPEVEIHSEPPPAPEPEPASRKIKADNEDSQLDSLLRELGIPTTPSTAGERRKRK